MHQFYVEVGRCKYTKGRFTHISKKHSFSPTSRLEALVVSLPTGDFQQKHLLLETVPVMILNSFTLIV